MKQRVFVLLLIAVVALAGCKARETTAQGSTGTDTIAPAAPKADTANEAMTQTVELDDSRSEAEGGGLTESSTAVTDTTSTTTAVKKKTGAAASSRKTPSSQSKPAGRTQ